VHTLIGKWKEFAMKDDVRLRCFITFILLAGVPRNRSAAPQDFIQPAMPQLLPLTGFLKLVLERVREHESWLRAVDGPVRRLCIH
jgi:hypothetical protein